MKWVIFTASVLFAVMMALGMLTLHARLRAVEKVPNVEHQAINDPRLVAQLEKNGRQIDFALGSDKKVYWIVTDKPKKKGWFGK